MRAIAQLNLDMKPNRKNLFFALFYQLVNSSMQEAEQAFSQLANLYEHQTISYSSYKSQLQILHAICPFKHDLDFYVAEVPEVLKQDLMNVLRDMFLR